jgi:hypothetical protein
VTYYHLSGAINGALFVLALGGLVSQIIAIRRRKGEHSKAPGGATAVLSLNYFSVSFLAYFAFFVYGFSIFPFNYYLVWPRFFGCLLVLVVLLEIARDRREPVSTAAAAVAGALISGGVALMASGGALGALTRLGPQLLSLLATALIAQSLVHQIVLLRRAGHPGAISWALHLLTLAKDLSTVVFGLAMGLSLGWPLLVMGGTSAGLKVVLLWQLHRSPGLLGARPAA